MGIIAIVGAVVVLLGGAVVYRKIKKVRPRENTQVRLEGRDTPDANRQIGSPPRGDQQPVVKRLEVVEMVKPPPANEAQGTPYDEEIGVDTSGRV